MKSRYVVITLFICAMTFATSSQAADNVENETVTLVSVDFKGKPPFKRRYEQVPVADIAALEKSPSEVKIVTVDFKGKPPFKRNVEKLTVVDIAALEGAEAANRTNFRGKPPFRRW